MALAGAAAGARVATRFKTHGDAGTTLLAAVGAASGALAGYLVAAISTVALLVVALLCAAALSATASLVAALLAGGASVAGARGRALRRRVAAGWYAATRAAFAPVRALRGRSRGAPARRTHGAGTFAPTADAVHADASDSAIEGTLGPESDRVELAGDLAGAIVAAAGQTRGVALADATAGTLVVHTDAGARIAVLAAVGEVCLASDPGRTQVYLGDAAPRTWGVPRTPRGRRTRASDARRVDVWCVPVGARVRIEGGTWRTPHLADGAEAIASVPVLEGTTESPVRVTVLDFGAAAPADRATAAG